MDTPFSGPEIYKQEFNSKDYYDSYYSSNQGALLGEWTDFVLRNFHQIFSSGNVKGNTLIDIGAGPTIYHLLSACEVFTNIITSDFLEQNLTELKKWLKKESNMLDWTPCVKFVCDLEGKSVNLAEKEEKLCKTVTQVLKCDVLKKNPFEPLVLPPADCLISCLCLEAACKDVASYCNTLKSLKDLLKPGGHVIIQSALNTTFYYVGEKKFYCLSITKKDIEKAFVEAGYEIVNLEVKQREDKSKLDISDYDSIYCVHARKPCSV
ncbi:nicotinamide N-methyltransferase-like [Pelobates cultripes]|uniref:Nicotinamide N-methyltransferase-like n=1 Tax=Pelobates cultripes TaxID=61616 RepID=A0AAD1TAP9_PELCU|nr:nicotinamide N-methyltransferase-like [Pelobates cultripes]